MGQWIEQREMQNRRLDPTGLAKPGETRGSPGMGPGLDRKQPAVCVFGRFWNRTELFFRSKPRPLADYPDPLLTPAAGSVPVQDERLSYPSMNLGTSTPPKTGAPMVPRCGICFILCAIARATDSINCPSTWTWLGEEFAEGLAPVEDLACLEGPALEEVVRPLEPAAEVDRQCSVDILVLFVAAWRWDGGLGGEFAVIGDLRSIASLWVFGRGVGSIGALFWGELFVSFFS